MGLTINLNKTNVMGVLVNTTHLEFDPEPIALIDGANPIQVIPALNTLAALCHQIVLGMQKLYQESTRHSVL